MANLFRCGAGGGLSEIVIPKLESIFSVYSTSGSDTGNNRGSSVSANFYIPDEVKKVSFSKISCTDTRVTNVRVDVYSGSSVIKQNLKALEELDISSRKNVILKCGYSSGATLMDVENKVIITDIQLTF